ncbi:hypothetical protein L1987_64646 [Smallanthus sonchifolius]|uniref:Uncharacterized protein n=1 Tax=Smallanthus sonchifolius TaxID=185202 RepID=A0ACB9BS60_9ASTR|nr:hypothetical protein L1987_64646 [Smallanthus sonchifolius]
MHDCHLPHVQLSNKDRQKFRLSCSLTPLYPLYLPASYLFFSLAVDTKFLLSLPVQLKSLPKSLSLSFNVTRLLNLVDVLAIDEFVFLL